jgi:hypothetical protein
VEERSLTSEEEERLLQLANEPERSQETLSDPILFLRREAWGPGRSMGPTVAGAFYFYRLAGGAGSGAEFTRALTLLGFRRKIRNSIRYVLMIDRDARRMRAWEARNPVPPQIRRALNTRARPSERRLANLSGTSSSSPTPRGGPGWSPPSS